MESRRVLFLLSRRLAVGQLQQCQCIGASAWPASQALRPTASRTLEYLSAHPQHVGTSTGSSSDQLQQSHPQQHLQQCQLPSPSSLQGNILSSSFSSSENSRPCWQSSRCYHVSSSYHESRSTVTGAGATPGTASSTSTSTSSSSSTTSSSNDASRSVAAAGSSSFQVPLAVASAVRATGAATAAASKATAKQVSKLLKLMQQTSLLQAAHLQLSSVWQSHSTAITTLAAAAATAGLYQITHATAGLFVDVSSTEAMLGCAAGAAAAVGGVGLYIRSGLVVDPERVYQVAMRKLTHHAGLQEVMGTPLAGSAMRVQLITCGSYFIQETLLPKRRAPRIHMLFPLTGPLKSGVVSLEAKKIANGKYAFKTLLVELPSKTLAGASGAAAATIAAVRAQEQFEAAAPAAAASAPKAAPISTQAAAAGTGSGDSSSSRSGGSSTGLGTHEQDIPARVYIVGGPRTVSSSSNSSSNSNAAPTAGDAALRDAPSAPSGASSGADQQALQQRVPAARVLLEQLKHPLMLALQQNIVVYETEDELEGLGYNTILELDPEQLTIWDRTKHGACVVVKGGVHYGKVAGCKVVGAVRRSLAAAREAAARSAPAARAPGKAVAASGQTSVAGAGPPATAVASTIAAAPVTAVAPAPAAAAAAPSAADSKGTAGVSQTAGDTTHAAVDSSTDKDTGSSPTAAQSAAGSSSDKKP